MTPSPRANALGAVKDALQEALAYIKHYDIGMKTAIREKVESALLSLPTIEGWQGIETAPRDGTRIMGYFKHTMPDMQLTVVRYVYEAEHYPKDMQEGWQDDGGTLWTVPDYWQHLPRPPGERA